LIISALIFSAGRRQDVVMSNENSQPESEEKKKRDVEVHDLKPKLDPKGGTTDAKKDDKRPSGRTGEADFMKGVN
jgi:hypothetical protein